MNKAKTPGRERQAKNVRAGYRCLIQPRPLAVSALANRTAPLNTATRVPKGPEGVNHDNPDDKPAHLEGQIRQRSCQLALSSLTLPGRMRCDLSLGGVSLAD